MRSTTQSGEVIVPSKVELGGRLAGMSIPKQVFLLASWPFLQNLLGVIVSFVDRMIAGRMVGVDQAALMDMMGLAMYMNWLMMIMQGSVATGGQALISRAIGGADEQLAQRSLGQSLTLGALAGVLAGGLVWLLVPFLTPLFGLSEKAADYAEIYMGIVALSSPLLGVIVVANACLKGAGDTKSPFIAMVVVNLVNLAMSFWFVFGLGWGIAGLAWGTFVGWLVGTLVILWIMRPNSKSSALRMKLAYLTLEAKLSRRILRISYPQLIEILGMWAIHAYTFRVIGQLGQSGALGAHGVVVQLEALSFMPGFAIGSAAATLAGQYLGAKAPEVAMKAVRMCWYTGMAMMGTAGLVLFLFAEPLVHFILPLGGEQAELAVPVVQLCAFAQPFFATAMVLKMSMRGAGATRLVMTYSFSVMILIKVIALSLSLHYFEPSLWDLWAIMMCDFVVQAIVFVYLHYKGKWTEAVV